MYPQETNPIPISNRRRWLLIFLPAIISLIGLIALFVFQQQLTPTWQIAMESYQINQAERGNEFEVLAVVTALLPQEYGTNEPFRAVETIITASPMPPVEIRCVETRPIGRDERQILLLIRHTEDAKPNDWVIYEAAGTEGRVNRSIAEIGCFFPSFEEN
jgi:hypothetical protein